VVFTKLTFQETITGHGWIVGTFYQRLIFRAGAILGFGHGLIAVWSNMLSDERVSENNLATTSNCMNDELQESA